VIQQGKNNNDNNDLPLSTISLINCLSTCSSSEALLVFLGLVRREEAFDDDDDDAAVVPVDSSSVYSSSMGCGIVSSRQRTTKVRLDPVEARLQNSKIF
jgi:hypothetical protein